MFVKLTRVYKLKGKSGLKSQTISINPDTVASIRPSNRLGYPEHRTTITLIDGREFDLKEKYTAVKNSLSY